MAASTRIFPVFAVADLEAAVDFYRRRLGFDLAWTWGEPAVRAGVAFHDIEIHLDASGRGGPPGPSVAYCHVDDVSTYHRQCAERGVEFALDLGERPWGMIDFRVLDPDGNRLGFGSPSEVSQ
jgi:catechol 2,3-dioxygenase-like lactoylglutathione lyase family enzyme